MMLCGCEFGQQSSLTLLKDYIEDIYFFEVNTKYISSNSRVHGASEFSDIFNT